ncbi:hypothetical protein GGF42_007997 [Coemansia sp. RSA 2424]|nr:hypothetical protein GGF42_007997 [Coemansia sp. RSA 2424]
MAAPLDEVDLILKHRFTQDQVCEYLVQWSGDLARTWEPSVNLTECQTLLNSYWREFCATLRNFEFLSPSFTLVTDNEASDGEEEEDGDEKKKKEKDDDTPPSKRPAMAKKPSSSLARKRPTEAEDKIAVAKRVQMNKQLIGVRSRAGISKASEASSSSGSSRTKPPPPTAKLSTVAAAFDDEFDETEPLPLPTALPPARRGRSGAQVARKSTGGYRPMPRITRPDPSI